MDQVIQRVAEQLGFQAARIWPQVVMVTWVTSLFWAIVDPLLFVVGAVLLVRLARWSWRGVEANRKAREAAKAKANGGYVSFLDYDSTDVVLVGCFGGFALLVLMTITLAAWPSALAGALYPEATTVLSIAKGFK